MSELSAHEAMHELGQQSDPLREALRRMIAEFGDQHYEWCPANWSEGHENHGPCECFAGHLIKDVRAVLEGTPALVAKESRPENSLNSK